jgi:predicted metalloprotease with PDZ domain
MQFTTWSTLALASLGTMTTWTSLAGSPGPQPSPVGAPIEAPKDRPYPGDIQLTVDASDVARRIVHIHERVTTGGGDTVLLYPRWLPGHHDASGTIERIAGIQMTAHGAPVAWTRDSLDVFAFHVHAPAATRSVDVEFDYLSPTNPQVGAPEIGRDIMLLEWNELVLYPAGYFVRQIPVNVSLTLPADWQLASALETASTSGATTTFKRLSLETLIDSPVYAGRYAARFDLDPGGVVPVRLNLFADRPELLEVKPEQLAAHRALVQQAYKLYGSHHYAHYDFLYSLSDQIHFNGLEHHQSSEDGTEPESFTEWDKTAYTRDLLPHEYTHSWNGKFRRPADLWTANYSVPMQGSLLWVYEGQTQYWGKVLAARSALRTHQQALDELALIAASYEHQAGRQWRNLEDTTNDPIMNPRRPLQSWRSWQRFEDYYSEAALVWLDADTLIRERSEGKRSLDDFARAFFGINDGSTVTVTYTFGDVVKALNAVEPYDWATFLHQRLDSVDEPAPLDGLRRGGYKLVYTDTPNDLQKTTDEHRKHLDLFYSVGVEVSNEGDKKGAVSQVLWGSPAFNAKLTAGAQILAVNGLAYSSDLLKDAIRSAKGGHSPIELMIRTGDVFKVVDLDYHEGLRYPHLVRDESVPARLDDILTARP